MNRKLIVASLCLLATGFWSRGADIVNNLGGGYYSTVILDGTPDTYAQAFMTPPAGFYVVTNVSLSLSDQNGSGSSVFVDLRQDAGGGSPGAQLMTISNSVTLNGFQETIYALAVRTNMLLQPNTKCWIVLGRLGGNPGWVTRNTSGSGLGTMPDEDATSDNGGIFWLPGNGGEYPAMAVQGTLLDWGDAPANFPVTLASNGAAHIPSGPVLGTLVDGETNGLPSAAANADDLDGSDDEDGVVFGSLRAGTQGSVTVTVSAASGRIDAWLDFNRDGIWSNSEQIVTNQLASVGTTNFTFNIPVPVTAGTNIARVRISTGGNLQPTGIATDGEVEDHAVGILQAVYTRYVALNGGHIAPFTNWTAAATNIQDAVDAAGDGDTILVTNGIYDTGGRVIVGTVLTNRVVINRPVRVVSVNGPGFTTIRGGWTPLIGDGVGPAATRCVYLTNGAVLSGFTLTNAATLRHAPSPIDTCGGAVYCEPLAFVSNCFIIRCNASSNGGAIYQGRVNNTVMRGNTAYAGGGAFDCILSNCTLWANAGGANGGGANTGRLDNCIIVSNYANFGGGVYASTVNNSILIRNTAGISGGGAFNGKFYNCTITFNTASYGGGIYGNIFPYCYNTIVWSNTATVDYTNYSSTVFEYSCSDPLPSGTGNISADPKLENPSALNARLRANSPCRNAGLNAYATGATDLDGRTRIISTAVDMGAYEFADTDNDGLPDWWETQYGLNPAASNNAVANADGDALNDLAEYIADTNPTNAASLFNRTSLLASSTNAAPDTITLVISNSSAGRLYSAQTTTNLTGVQTWTFAPPELLGNGSNLLITLPATNAIRTFRTGVRLP